MGVELLQLFGIAEVINSENLFTCIHHLFTIGLSLVMMWSDIVCDLCGVFFLSFNKMCHELLDGI